MTIELPEVVQALLNPRIYPDKTERVKLVQTQMSFVFLTGKYVYKIKKPVNLGYLDYTTLEKRRFFCEQEVKLNRRLCGKAYLGVIPITRSQSGFSLMDAGEAVEYAVKMRYLPQGRMMNVLLDRDQVSKEMVEEVARKLVDFHAEAETSPAISEFGKIEAIRINVEENFSQTQKYIGSTISAQQFQRIKDYTYEILQKKASIFNERVANGRIRDCHGDLHSQHVCFSDGICIYDCIEFNDRFRYCDVASEIAFLAMDLDHYGRADLSRSFSNAYIDISRDSQIKELLRFYKGYRAYVRGKVGSFKYDDPYISVEERKLTLEAARSYFELAEAYSRSKSMLFITVGLVGSGKTTLAQAIAKRLGLTVISSDRVRKKLASIPATEHHFEQMESGIYSAEFSRRTYDELLSEARSILQQGDSVILDASFIKAEERQKALQVSEETEADFFVLECILDEENTQRRLAERLTHRSISDGRWEIYGPQKKKFEPVTEVPPDRHFVIDSAKPLAEQISQITAKI